MVSTSRRLEARAYAVARAYQPLLVNTVVGFIGPEYLYDGKQIIRAGLEDHFCGKLLGLPIGCDVCYTNHAQADQDDMDILLTLLGAAGVTFIIGVPGADDVMLNYQSTSFHDQLYIREVLGLRRAPEFEDWLRRIGVTGRDGRLRSTDAAPVPAVRAEGTGRMTDAKRPSDVPESWRRLAELTPARIALGRSGSGLLTREVLKFAMAHAQARDAVHTPFDAPGPGGASCRAGPDHGPGVERRPGAGGLPAPTGPWPPAGPGERPSPRRLGDAVESRHRDRRRSLLHRR